MSNQDPILYIAWLGAPFTLVECQLACALSIYVPFEDGSTMDDVTIGQVLGTFSSLDNMNCAGLVAHLKETNNVYPAVLNNRGKPPPVLNNHGQPIDSDLTWAEWARGWYDKWLDPKAIDPQAAKQGFWP